MSFTRTEQITIDNQPKTYSPGVLKLKGTKPSDSKIKELVVNLQKSEIFEKSTLNKWFENTSLEVFCEDGFKDEALNALTDLILNVVRPQFLKEATDDVYMELFEIDEQIKSLLETYLKGTDAEIYLEKQKSNVEVKKNVTLEKPNSVKVALLIESMEKSKLFSDSQLEQLAQWKLEIPYRFFDNLKTEDLKKLGSIALSLALIEFIQPALIAKPSQAQKQELLAMDKQVKALISTILPQGELLEPFIADCKSFANEKKLFNQKLEVIETIFKEAIKLLLADANAMDLKILEHFKMIQEKLLQLTEERLLKANEANNKMALLTKKVDTLINDLINESNNLIQIADNLKIYEINFHSMVEDCKSMLKDFKI